VVPGLSCFALDGRLSVDNNLSERLLRGVAITRKNFMLVGSDRGGDRAAVFYRLIETAKRNGLDPEAYIATIINRMATGQPARIWMPCCRGTSNWQKQKPRDQKMQRGSRLTLTKRTSVT
jgi:hypothetical protein